MKLYHRTYIILSDGDRNDITSDENFNFHSWNCINYRGEKSLLLDHMLDTYSKRKIFELYVHRHTHTRSESKKANMSSKWSLFIPKYASNLQYHAILGV